jgi:leader peptidase (prepilin peptidase)/N-methyltransferase
VELLTGLAFLACALNPDWQLKSTFVNSLFLALIIILIFIDYQHQILPNAITIPGTIVGILLSRFQYPSLYDETLARILSSFLGAPIYLIGSILGAIVGGGLLYLVGVAYLRFRKVQGLGMGDVKMMAMVGAFLGWQPTLITLFAGSVFGLLFGISLMIKKKATLQTPIPFGVFLGIGAAFSLFFGLLLLQKYLALFK